MPDKPRSKSRKQQEEDFTLGEVAERMNISKSKASQLVRSGELRAYYVGRLPRVTPKHLADFLGVDVASLTNSTTTPSDPGSPAASPTATRYTVRTTSATGKTSTREGLTAEQASAYTAWLLVDPEVLTYIVTKEPGR